MGGRISTFADLLAPVRPETFFEQYWEHEPLHIRRSENSFYENLLTHRDVESAISSGGLRYPAIQLAKDGGFFPAEAFTRNIRSGDDVFTGVPNLDRIRAEYEAGATVSLPAFHRAWEPLRTLVAAIEESFDHPAHANVYVTPGNAVGFSPHYDTHEVFVLQIAGGKRWRISQPAVALPHRSRPFDPRRDASSPVHMEVDLEAGDLLYLPRGFVHTTATSHRFSLHVTLGITVYTWVELLADWAQASKNHPSFRRALPPGFASREEVRRSLREQLPRMIAELQRTVDCNQLLADFARRLLAARAGTRAEFHTDVMAIGPRTELKTPNRDGYVITGEGDKVVLKFRGKILVLDKGARPLLEEICGKAKFCSMDLSQALGEAATLAVVRLLYKEGFLSPVSLR